MERRLTTVRYEAINRRATKEGVMMKRGHMRKNWKRRWFVLAERKLHYFHSPAKVTTTTKALGVVDLEGYQAEVFEEATLSAEWQLEGVTFFRLTHASKPQYDLCTEQEVELQEWLQAILLEIHLKIPSFVHIEDPEDEGLCVDGNNDDASDKDDTGGDSGHDYVHHERLKSRSATFVHKTMSSLSHSIGGLSKDGIISGTPGKKEQHRAVTYHGLLSSPITSQRFGEKGLVRATIFSRKSQMASLTPHSPPLLLSSGAPAATSSDEEVEDATSQSPFTSSTSAPSSPLKPSSKPLPPPPPLAKAQQRLHFESEEDERVWSSSRMEGILLAFAVLCHEAKEYGRIHGPDKNPVGAELRRRLVGIRPQLLVCMQEHPQEFVERSVTTKYDDVMNTLEFSQEEMKQLRLNASGAHVCSLCSLPLQGKAVEVGAKRYHSVCFVCSACRSPLGASCISIGHQSYCDTCGRQAFTLIRARSHPTSAPPDSSPPTLPHMAIPPAVGSSILASHPLRQSSSSPTHTATTVSLQASSQ
eukprot:TRINITY_DN2683_c0_g1_i4.p1 TRINITY_DN2683_c0_g1~~TRINITY_DN2683_c0_g1_i4.p1  ORF type:complete len:530 (-),score=72.30 TRINITY_DN2683_c0_g1_i4:76-1665(-)